MSPLKKKKITHTHSVPTNLLVALTLGNSLRVAVCVINMQQGRSTNLSNLHEGRAGLKSNITSHVLILVNSLT